MWPNPDFPADLVTFTGEILNWKFHFLCSVYCMKEIPNTALVPSGVSLTSWGGVTLALGSHPSSDGIMVKIPYGVDVLLH